MASQSLQLVEGVSKISLRSDVIAVPDFFKPRSEHGERLLPRCKGLRKDQLGFCQRSKIFARSLREVRGQRAEVLKARDARPVSAMNRHTVVAAPGRFSRAEEPLLPGPRENCRRLQRHFRR